MIWLEIRNLRLVLLVISVLCKKSFQNKPEYEFAPTLSFEPVTFVQHEDKQSDNGFWNANAPEIDKKTTEDIVPGLGPAVHGHRRMNRQATYDGQTGHAQVPTSYSQNGFNSAPTKYPGDQLLSHPSYGGVTPSPQYPYYNNFQSGQSPYYPSNQRPGYSQYPSNLQPGQMPQYPNNLGSTYHQSPNHTRPGYTQPSIPSASTAPGTVTPGYHYNNQPGQLAQYPTDQRPGYPANRYPSNSQFGQSQQNSGHVTPGYVHYYQPGQLPQYAPSQRPGYPDNQYPSNLGFGPTLPNSGHVTPGYHLIPSFNQSGHSTQHPINQRAGYNQYPDNSQSDPSPQYPSNQNPTHHQNSNYQGGYGHRYKRYASPIRPGCNLGENNGSPIWHDPNYVQVIPGNVRPK